MVETRPVDQIIVGERKRKHMGDIDALAASIRNRGLLHPIVIDDRARLICGQRRLLAFQSLGINAIPVHVIPVGDILACEVEENTVRADFRLSEMVDVAHAVEEEEKKKAKERMSQGGALSRPGGRGADSAPLPDQGKSRVKVAAYLGVSHDTVTKATAIVTAAEDDPDQYGPLVELMDRTGKVNGVHKRLMVMQKAEAIRREPPPMPFGPFRVIVVDPPWRYRDGPEPVGRRVSLPYPSMSIDEIAALPVREAAHDDAILWLWTTNTHLRAAFGILDAWGFEHRTILTWVKDRMGTGDWLRGQTEHCLLAVRGTPTVVLTNQTTALMAPMRDHSGKPDEFYALVEAMCPGSKLEMYARRERPGWRLYGDEAPLEARDAATE